MKLTTKLGAAGALALGAFGAVSAFGGHAGAAQTPAVVPSVDASNVANTPPPVNTPALTPPAAPETDNVQSGDQTTPDTPATAAEAAASVPETGSAPEVSGAPGDGPGGHQDNGVNADHQFQGSE